MWKWQEVENTPRVTSRECLTWRECIGELRVRGLGSGGEVGGGEARTPVPVTLTPVLQVHTSTSSKSSKFSKNTPAEGFSPRCMLFVASVAFLSLFTWARKTLVLSVCGLSSINTIGKYPCEVSPKLGSRLIGNWLFLAPERIKHYCQSRY